jgi:hypothetical protein
MYVMPDLATVSPATAGMVLDTGAAGGGDSADFDAHAATGAIKAAIASGRSILIALRL